MSERELLVSKRDPGELLTHAVLFGIAMVSASITVFILIFFVIESSSFFLAPGFSLREFVTGTSWRPAVGDFGLLPLLVPTIVIAIIAIGVAMPMGISLAVVISEYASPRVRRIVRIVLEVFSGIPTVVFGYFALTKLTPFLQGILGVQRLEPFNLLSAGITVGLLITPYAFTMLEERFSRIPAVVREAPISIGATRFEAFRKTVLPAAERTIRTTMVLSFARAIGESMIVSLAAGSGSILTANPLRGAETMTGYIVRISSGGLTIGTVDYTSIFGLAIVLYLLTIGSILVASRRSRSAGMFRRAR